LLILIYKKSRPSFVMPCQGLTESNHLIDARQEVFLVAGEIFRDEVRTVVGC
jgi:hypothetical protein